MIASKIPGLNQGLDPGIQNLSKRLDALERSIEQPAGVSPTSATNLTSIEARLKRIETWIRQMEVFSSNVCLAGASAANVVIGKRATTAKRFRSPSEISEL